MLRHRPRRQCGQDFGHGIQLVENLSDTDRMHVLLLLLLWQFGNMDQGGRGGNSQKWETMNYAQFLALWNEGRWLKLKLHLSKNKGRTNRTHPPALLRMNNKI